MNLDFMALALLTILIRHRDGWDLTLERIGKKYGYGREALAKAMGLLMVAQYVVKIRMMSVHGNQWSTEVYVYDTPATEAEVEALLEAVEKESEVVRAEVIQPTKTALEHAASRRTKLAAKDTGRQGPSVAVPRVQENPHSGATCGNDEKPQVGPECRDSRQSGDPAVFKKTVGEKTKEDEELGGDGRQAPSGSRGSRGGGSAASGRTNPPPLTRDDKRRYEQAVAALPPVLASLVPKNAPRDLRQAVLDALDSDGPAARTPEQLVDYRLMPKWRKHYGSRDSAGPIRKPVGVLKAMLRWDAECGDKRCDERTNVDSGEACRACEMRAVDRRADREREQRSSRPAGPPVDVPGPRTEPVPVSPVVHQPTVVVDASLAPLGDTKAGMRQLRAAMVEKALRPRV
ncbi:hypothetical protein [Streptomyces sp. NBC_00878]|uniref:hypothetical protein n=1 Tax=Streptomyces sp. NBC_00878 TaxID=2975854 RepID=UPI002252B95E|nr:hypothetical protein [Streptomyces sp. NBC_00878]